MKLNKNPLISVVMSIYDEPAGWLKTSIESILNQTYSNIEFIIINGVVEKKKVRATARSVDSCTHHIIMYFRDGIFFVVACMFK